MPFKPVEMPKCPACGKSVYAAEERLAGGFKWHKGCFKCSMCNKMLDSTNNNTRDSKLFCKASQDLLRSIYWVELTYPLVAGLCSVEQSLRCSVGGTTARRDWL